MNSNYTFYIGPEYVNNLGYKHILTFKFYNFPTKTQIININVFYWSGYNIKSNKSLYVPFFTKGIKHELFKYNLKKV